jgi:hypothetical protein
MIPAACGSSDKQVAARGAAGAAGEAGAVGVAGASGQSGSTDNAGGANTGGAETGGVGGQPTGQGGARTQPEGGGAGVDSGGLGGVPALGDGGALSAAGAAGVGGQGGAPSESVVDIGFDDSSTLPANIDPGTAVLTPSQGFEPLGPEGNKFGSTFLRGPTGTVITLTLTDLPPHETLSLSLLFAAIDSLDGEGTFPAGDYFKITLDGVIVFRESFANAIVSQIQSYNPPAEVVLARHQDLGFSGPGGYYTDSAYDFGLDPTLQNLVHTASTATLKFELEGEGVQSIDDESWAIDNIRVTAH